MGTVKFINCKLTQSAEAFESSEQEIFWPFTVSCLFCFLYDYSLSEMGHIARITRLGGS